MRSSDASSSSSAAPPSKSSSCGRVELAPILRQRGVEPRRVVRGPPGAQVYCHPAPDTAGEKSPSKRAPCQYPHAVALAHGKDGSFDSPAEDRVWRLFGTEPGQAPDVSHCAGRHDLRRRERRAADRPAAGRPAAISAGPASTRPAPAPRPPARAKGAKPACTPSPPGGPAARCSTRSSGSAHSRRPPPAARRKPPGH